jgi:hypothetical protein
VSRREDIDNAIWTDPDFEALSAEATLLYLWSWTNPRCGMAGIYKVSERAMTESKVMLEQVPAALDELAEAHFAFYEQQVLWVRSRVKHLRTQTPQIARSIAKDLAAISVEHPLRLMFLEVYGAVPWLSEQLEIIAPENGWDRGSLVSPRARAAVMERDGFRCKKCRATTNLTIDHILPRSAGGSGKVENLQVLCVSCNSKKGVSLTVKRPSKDTQNTPINTSDFDPQTNLDRGSRVLGQGQGTGNGKGDGGSGGKVELPADFPDELRPHLEAVFRILRALAERHNAKAVNPLSLASVLMARKHKPLVKAAYDFSAWSDGHKQPRKDVVAGYRNWLENTDDLASVERLDGANVVAIVDRQAKEPGKYELAMQARTAQILKGKAS